MYHPTTRLLAILELLQSRGEMRGPELALALEVEERSIRRYILMLREMGIPIEGERGRHGGYSLRPGFRLPPLMFNPDEITAVIMGLMLMREFGYTALPAVESAAAKITRVLPEGLQQRVDALRAALALNQVQLGARSISNEQIAIISLAVYAEKCLRITYQAAEADVTERIIAPYGLVLHSRTWYIPAYCYLRAGMRVFRLDRFRSITSLEQHFERPAAFDPTTFVLDRLAQTPGLYQFEVLLHAPLAAVSEVVSPGMAVLEDQGRQTLLRCYADDPTWFARWLARLDLPFTVLQTDELRAALRSLAADLLAAL